jgi:hypothetical protein
MTSIFARRIALVATSLALLLAASAAAAQAVPCKTDRDCPDKGLCMTGKCKLPKPPPVAPIPAPTPAPAPAPECAADKDCAGANMVCTDGKCVEQQPAPAPAPAPAPKPLPKAVPGAKGCVADSDCPGQQVCRNGGCGAPVEPTYPAGCVRDTDCKGQRICISGECVEPGEGYKVPTLQKYKDIPMTGEPNWMIGYLQVSGLLQIHSWGSWSATDPNDTYEQNLQGDYDGGVWGGIHVAAYYAPVEIVQVGAFFMFTTGGFEFDEDHDYLADVDTEGSGMINSFGVTIKVGGRPAGHVWVGGIIDVGYAMWDFEGTAFDEEFRADAVMIFPRVGIDILAVDSNGFKLAFPLSVGAIATPYAYTEVSWNNSDIEPWMISPAVTAGLILGGGRAETM